MRINYLTATLPQLTGARYLFSVCVHSSTEWLRSEGPSGGRLVQPLLKQGHAEQYLAQDQA